VFKNASPPAYAGQRRCEATTVVSALVTPPCLDEAGEPTPARARRMGDYRMWARIQPSVSRFIPRINAVEAKIATAALNNESGDCLHALFVD
jgi:hypothetical protein